MSDLEQIKQDAETAFVDLSQRGAVGFAALAAAASALADLRALSPEELPEQLEALRATSHELRQFERLVASYPGGLEEAFLCISGVVNSSVERLTKDPS